MKVYIVKLIQNFLFVDKKPIKLPFTHQLQSKIPQMNYCGQDYFDGTLPR